MVEKMIEKLNSLAPMNEVLADRVRALAKITTFAAGELILREGQVCNRACLVVEGLTRSYYLNEGVDITSRFMEEGFIVTSWPSYYTQKPGNEFIEAMEDTSLACLNYSDIQQLYIDFPEFNINGRRQTEYAFYLSELRTLLLRKHTAEEKYKYFLHNHPTLMQRVALKHIATYLGMSEETLSRVRSRFHKNNS
ncbi:MAG: Crp/Fnr family transcriptional regulator [Chitinophagaceae bacterium]|nr:Crp/Fnr family transcriptional regulator [Chitinophagaceae bacterium]